MCLAAPGRIKEIKGHEATIEYPHEIRRAFLGDDIKAKVGDYVLVQMGVVVKKLSKKEVQKTKTFWDNKQI